MAFKKLLYMVALVSLLTGCSSSPPVDRSPQPQELIYKGFALNLPPGSGWHEIRNSPYQVTLVKPGQGKYERYTIQALVVDLPEFASDDEFLRYIKNNMTDSSEQDATEQYEQSVSFIPGQYDQCIQYKSKSVDMSTMSVEESAEPMILEMVNFTCRHPEKKGAGIYLAYARRYYPESEPVDVHTRALEIFNRLEMTGL